MKKVVVLLLCILLFPRGFSHAVLAPDFLVQVGVTIGQTIAIVGVIVAAGYGIIRHFFLTLIGKASSIPRWVDGVVLFIVIVLAIIYAVITQGQIHQLQSGIVDLQSVQAPEDGAPDFGISDIEPIPQPDNAPVVEISKEETAVLPPLAVSNAEFAKTLVSDTKNFIILDAREDIEFNAGHIPGSLHMRFADIAYGTWRELPQDKNIYVICSTGRRGGEVATFLQDRGLKAQYIVNGSEGWFYYGGEWEGEVYLLATYQDEQYRKVLTTAEIQKEITTGSVIVDARSKEKYTRWHIPGSIHVTTVNTPTALLGQLYTQVPWGAKIVVVCDDYSNCFDAKITGIELEKRGNILLGRYAKPWDYRQTYAY